MGSICGTLNDDDKPQTTKNAKPLFSMLDLHDDPEARKAKTEITRLNLLIDNYNHEVETMNDNITNLNQKALDYKRNNQRHMALFCLTKRKYLIQQSDKVSRNSIILLDRKHKIEELKRGNDFAKVLRETNDVISKYLNNDVIGEIRRANELQNEAAYNTDEIMNMNHDPDIESEYEALDPIVVETSHIKPPSKVVKVNEVLFA